MGKISKHRPSRKSKERPKEKEKAKEDLYYQENLDVGTFEDEKGISDEDIEFQETEALRLQKETLAALEEEDFGAADLLRAAKRAQKYESVACESDPPKFYDNPLFKEEVEHIASSLDATLDDQSDHKTAFQKNLKRLSAAEQQRVVSELHPEMMPLLEDISEKLSEFKEAVSPTMIRLDNNKAELESSEGLSFLECKNELMLTYMSYLCYYLLLKAYGMPVASHPVIDRLVESRLLLEKLRPIESKLKYQIEKIIRSVSKNGQSAGDRKKVMQPRPDLLTSGKEGLQRPSNDLDIAGDLGAVNTGTSNNSGGHDIYTPPRLLAVELDGQQKKLTDYQKACRNLDHKRRKLERSEFVKHLREELLEVPQELSIGNSNALEDEESARLMELQTRREEEEEINMMRMPQSSKDKKALDRLKKKKHTLSGVVTLDDIVAYADETLGDDTDARNQTSLSRYLAAGRQAAKIGQKERAAVGADHSVKFRNKATVETNHLVEKVQIESDGDSEEEIIDDIELGRKEKLRHKDVKDGKVPSIKHEQEINNRRKVTKKIEKNRGLVPNRKKYESNPRLHNRVKFEKKLKKHRAINPTNRTRSADGSYSGELSGMGRANVARSRRLA